MLTRRIYLPISRQARRLSAKPAEAKPEMKLDDDVNMKLNNEEIKARKHPGRLCSRLAVLPEWLPKALEVAVEDTPLPGLFRDGKDLSNYLHARQVPVEQTVRQAKLNQLKEDMASQRDEERLAQQSVESVEQMEHHKSIRLLKRAFYAWAPVEYTKYSGLAYLVSRSAQEYAVLHKIFTEIATRNKDFKPRSLLDFGSGVGSTIWAASQCWPRVIQEHMCIDVSAEMNDLSQLMLEQAAPKVKGLSYRQYIPISQRTYDVVVSAYTLLELPSIQTRLETIAKLWARTEKYLVIVEQGTNAGFRLVNEARDFIIHMQQHQKEGSLQPYHIFSPCPHQFSCPRSSDRTNTPCNFQTSFQSFRLGKRETIGSHRYSYVVLKKGECTDETKNWPRLVRETLKRSKHSTCRLCTAEGKLEEHVFTAKNHGKWMYWCARSSRWGDRLPVEMVSEAKSQEAESSTMERRNK